MTSERTVLFVVVSLALIGFAGLICITILLIYGKNAEGLIGLAGAAVGGLVGILTTTHSRTNDKPTADIHLEGKVSNVTGTGGPDDGQRNTGA